MKNYFKNMVFLSRNTSLTLTEIDNWSYFEFEMYVTELTETLRQEDTERRKKERQQTSEQNNMQHQMNNYMRMMQAKLHKP